MRTHVYVDGFNLYYGAVAGTPYKWLNIVDACRELLPDNDVQRVHYFTARVKPTPDDPSKAVRQQTFIRALETLPEIRVTYGTFLVSRTRMRLAKPRRASDSEDDTIVTLGEEGPTSAIVQKTEEKGSDVNLATVLLAEAFRGEVEAAAVLSVDSDLALPIKLVKTELHIPVGVIFPKGRSSVTLDRVASFRKTLDSRILKRCQLPETLEDAHGEIRKPDAW